MQLLSLISEVVVIFILLVFLSKKNKQIHDKILIFWFCLIIIQTHSFYLQSINPYHFIVEISSAIVFLHGPTIWFYYHTLTTKKIQFRFLYFLHLLPFAVNLYLILPSFIHQQLTPFTEVERNILMVVKFISILSYVLITILHLSWHKKLVKDFFSNTQKIELQWLQVVLFGILFIWILAAFSQLAVHLRFEIIDRSDEDIYVNIAVNLWVISIAYYGFKQGSVFQNLHRDVLTIENEEKNKELVKEQPNNIILKKYTKSRLDKETIERLALTLMNHMKNQKPYLDPDLNLLQLAKAVNLSTNDLSQVINEYYKMNFYDFINRDRVESVKQAIINGDTKTKTLLGIAFDSGFNSKASFNRAFKKMTGQTPTEYILNQKKLN